MKINLLYLLYKDVYTLAFCKDYKLSEMFTKSAYSRLVSISRLKPISLNTLILFFPIFFSLLSVKLLYHCSITQNFILEMSSIVSAGYKVLVNLLS